MANVPGPRALDLAYYFTREHGFLADKYNGGIITFKRINSRLDMERVVVKHAEAPQNNWGRDRNDEILDEARILRQLWGAEHIIRLLAIVDNQHHQSANWNEPFYRVFHHLSRLLPWKLTVSQIDHPAVRQFHFFVMEFLSRGDAGELIARCQGLGINEISEPLLWYFFLCLIRGCVAIAWPPNRGNLNPPAIVREQIPNPMRRASRLIHGDLHIGNVMFGEFDPSDNTQPACHRGVPILKIIDFGLADNDENPHEAQWDNILHIAEIMTDLANMSEGLVYDHIRRPSFVVDDILGLNPFDSWLDEDFYRSGRYSDEFMVFLALCMAEQPNQRPSVRRALRICEHNVALLGNWRALADEVNEIFDMPPLDPDSDSDSDGAYRP